MIVDKIQNSNQFQFKNKFSSSNNNTNFGLRMQNPPVQDEFNAHPFTEYVKNKLKDEETLYKLFNGIKCDINPEILQNEDFMQDLYGDIDFLEASCSAIKRTLEDKLDDENLSEEKKSELTMLHDIFSFRDQEEPQTISKVALNGNYFDTYSASSLKLRSSGAIAFGKGFGYFGFINKPKTRREKAEAIVNRCAAAAAAESGALLIGADIVCPGSSTVVAPFEPLLLTATTTTMCRQICKTYQMPGRAITSIISQLTGYYVGNAVSNTLTSYIPLVGGYVNATTTFALHQAQGRAIIKWCEANYKNKNIKDWDIVAKELYIVKSLDEIL